MLYFDICIFQLFVSYMARKVINNFVPNPVANFRSFKMVIVQCSYFIVTDRYFNSCVSRVTQAWLEMKGGLITYKSRMSVGRVD